MMKTLCCFDYCKHQMVQRYEYEHELNRKKMMPNKLISYAKQILINKFIVNGI